MKKPTTNKKGQGNRKVLATKKSSAALVETQNGALKFTQVSEGELKTARNSAYTYLVK